MPPFCTRGSKGQFYDGYMRKGYCPDLDVKPEEVHVTDWLDHATIEDLDKIAQELKKLRENADKRWNTEPMDTKPEQPATKWD